jgi:hypothetical protein
VFYNIICRKRLSQQGSEHAQEDVHVHCICTQHTLYIQNNVQMQIHCPDDYRHWLGSLFGIKFVKLYSGPMWRVETTSQDLAVSSQSKVPVEVCYSNILLVSMKVHGHPSTTHQRRKKQRLLRGEQVHTASFASGRASLPVPGTLTVRPKFHKHPVSVPPPSSIPSYVHCS